MQVTDSRREAILQRIAEIQSAGSTALELGLRLGYNVAEETGKQFEGITRVMLFTDERPNVGNTHAQGFMTMARAASQSGIGLTTIGVGVQFDAQLATTIGSVRGGNLFFMRDEEDEFGANRRQIVIEGSGQVYDYEVRGNELVLADGKHENLVFLRKMRGTKK